MMREDPDRPGKWILGEAQVEIVSDGEISDEMKADAAAAKEKEEQQRKKLKDRKQDSRPKSDTHVPAEKPPPGNEKEEGTK